MSGFKLSDVPADGLAASHPGPADRPLGLTVHSLPKPHEVAAHEVRRTRVGRWKMLLVMLVCAAPVIASYLTYYVIRPEARRVYGVLIDPQRPLPDATAVGLDGAPVVVGHFDARQGLGQRFRGEARHGWLRGCRGRIAEASRRCQRCALSPSPA